MACRRRARPSIRPRRRSRRECRGSPPAAARRRRAFRAGGTAPSAHCRWRRRRRRAASPHSSSAAAERVVPRRSASAGTRGSRSVQMTSLPAGSRARVMPCATISASHRIGAPCASAARAAATRPLPNAMKRRRVDEAAGMDHPHRDLRLLGREAREIGLGADDGEGALVDRGAVAQIGGLSHGRPRLAGRCAQLRRRDGRQAPPARHGGTASPARCRRGRCRSPARRRPR